MAMAQPTDCYVTLADLPNSWLFSTEMAGVGGH